MNNMNDPYSVLGISSSASDEEVKQAYRRLAKKYHPDNYMNSPLADTASEKMKEINDAYDRILNERRQQKKGSSGTNPSYQYTQSGLTHIRMLINNGNFTAADEELSDIPSNQRNAEWYYLMGVVTYQRGWLEDAYNYFQTACRMDPSNVEYQAFFNRVREQRSGTQGGYQANTSSSGCDCCDICTCLMCSDCLCSFCGN